MNKALAILVGAGVGAGAMYMLDPKSGRRRRAMLRDQCSSAAHNSSRYMRRLSRDVTHRASEIAAETRSLLHNGTDLVDETKERVKEGLSPAMRVLAGAAGGTMTYLGARRRNDFMGATMGLLGVGMLSRDILNRALKLAR